MAKLYNLARMTTATTGTGTITLGSAVASYVTFANSGVQNGETVTYAIVDGNNREIGRGVYTASGTTLTRTVLESTNANNPINLSGNAEVFITASAEDITSSVEITGGTITGITDLAIADGGTGRSTASAAANALDGYLSITSAGTTTSLTNTSARTIVVTGVTIHTIQLPDVTTLALGWTFVIANTSTSAVTVQSSGGNSFTSTIATGQSARLVCIATTGTGTASWLISYFGGNSRTGTGSAVYGTSPAISSSTLSNPTINQVVYSPSAITAGTNAQGQGSIAASTEVANVNSTPNNPSGVTLPTATSGFRKVVLNNGTNPIVVYPATGATINGLAANAGVTIPVGYALEFTCSATGTWRTTSYGSQTLGTSGQALISNDASSAPTWGFPTALSTASGTAPSYSARAWVNFNGTGTVAIRASNNVSSITDSGVGNYTVNFTTAMSDANFCAVGNGANLGTAASASAKGLLPVEYATGSVRVVVTTGTGAAQDYDAVNVSVFR